MIKSKSRWKFLTYFVILGPVITLSAFFVEEIRTGIILMMIGLGVLMAGVFFIFDELRNEHKTTKR